MDEGAGVVWAGAVFEAGRPLVGVEAGGGVDTVAMAELAGDAIGVVLDVGEVGCDLAGAAKGIGVVVDAVSTGVGDAGEVFLLVVVVVDALVGTEAAPRSVEAFCGEFVARVVVVAANDGVVACAAGDGCDLVVGVVVQFAGEVVDDFVRRLPCLCSGARYALLFEPVKDARQTVAHPIVCKGSSCHQTQTQQKG